MKKILVALLLACVAYAPVLQAEGFDAAKLDAVLQAQPEDAQARYAYRHPAETLAFFEIAPGTVVVEALPGGGWYSKILAAYLGPEGRLVGVDYSRELFPLFGFFTEEQLQAKETWAEDWVAGTAEWGIEDGAEFAASVFGEIPEEMHGTADNVLFVRALHNLARFEPDGGFLTQAVKDAWDLLKPGGVVGVVQHWARPEMPDEWATGANGYLKYRTVTEAMKAAGFELVGAIDANENPLDQPTVDDKVWRLPPTLATSREDPDLRERMKAIGESNRMTLKFRKPAGE